MSVPITPPQTGALGRALLPYPTGSPHPFTTPIPCEKVHTMASKPADKSRVQQHAQQAAMRHAPRPARQAEEQRRASGPLAGAFSQCATHCP